MERKRTWQFALAGALPLIAATLIYFSTNQMVQISAAGTTSAIPLWAAVAGALFLIGLLCGGEFDRMAEVRRLNKLIVEERSAASGLEPDNRARSLLTGTAAEVGLVERRLALDLGLERKASVVLHERLNGRVSNVNSRRTIGFVHVSLSNDMKTVGALCKAIDAAYHDSIPGVEAHIVDTDGTDLHGNSKIKNLTTVKL